MIEIIILFGLFFIIFLAASSKKKTEKKEILSPEEKGWKGEEKVLNAIQNFFERKSPADYLLVNGLIL